jgi:DNA-binding transcriptional regulator/RsmH inhibitor MraZ
MKRRAFIRWAGLAAALGVPLAWKAAQSHSPTGSAASISPDLALEKRDRRQGVRSIPISQSRRISIPKHFNVGLPFNIVGLTDFSDNFICLAVCESSDLTQLRAQFGKYLCVYSEHRTSKPTLPRDICEKYSLAPGTNAWLIAVGNYLELWSEKAFDDMLRKAVGYQPDGFEL